MPGKTAYMTEAQYEVYGVIDKIQAEADRIRHEVEKDWRNKRLETHAYDLRSLVDDLEDAVSEWECEGENAPTVDEVKAKAVTP